MLQIAAGALIVLAVGVVTWNRLHPGAAPSQAPPAPSPAPTPEPPPAGQGDQTKPQSIFDLPLDPAPSPAPATTPNAPEPALPKPTPETPAPPPPEPQPAPPAPLTAPIPPAQPGPVAPTERPRPAPAPTRLLTFSDVKMITVEGTKGRDQDVLLNFVGGEVAIVAKKGGSTLRSMPYSRIASATYTHDDAPAWSRAASGPPPGFDVPHGVFDRRAHHWLVLQTRTDYLILRLDDSTWRNVLGAVESRTGVKVVRRAAPRTPHE